MLSNRALSIKNTFNEAALAAQLPFYEVPKYTPSEIICTIFTDPELIEFAQTHNKYKIPEDFKIKSLTPISTCLFLTDALNLDTQAEENPRLTELSSILKGRYSDVPNNESLRTNCYSLAAGNRNNALFIGAMPGQKSGVILQTLTTQNIIKKAQEDGLEYAGTDPEYLDVPQGHHIAMLYVYEGHDFHWVRLDQDKDGNLVAHEKLGWMNHKVKSQRVDNIYDFIEKDYSGIAGKDSKYPFSGFFYVPGEGFNVGFNKFLGLDGADKATIDREVSSLLAMHTPCLLIGC